MVEPHALLTPEQAANLGTVFTSVLAIVNSVRGKSSEDKKEDKPIQVNLVQAATDQVTKRLPIDADKAKEVAEQASSAFSAAPTAESAARASVERAGLAAANEGVGSFELQRVARKAAQAAAVDAADNGI